MAEYLLRNSLNPGKVIKCTITFRKLTNKGEEGEPVWLVQIGTVEPHKDGGDIAPVFIHYTSSVNLDAAVKKATEDIAKQVDWSPIHEDLRPPFVESSSPDINEDIVDIHSDVIVDIKDVLPAAGIDLSSIDITVNGFNVTNDAMIEGDPYQYRVIWRPPVRVLDTYM